MVGSKRRDIGLGGYPAVSLAEARQQAKDNRVSICGGIDPILRKKAAKSALIASQAKALKFTEAARQCHAAKAPEFRNLKHRKDWLSALEMHAFPVIGDMQVSLIQTPDVLRVLKPIWQEKTETATRVRQRLEAVLNWAAVSGFREGENPARWKGNLSELLPNPSKIRTIRHHPALPWVQIAIFIQELRQKEGIAAKALEFAILTASRSSEVRGMVWEELDFDKELWMIPANRIKSGRRHMVPLSKQAIAILRAVPVNDQSPFVFAAPRGGMLSDVALLAVMRRMGVDAVPHGFRSTFKDWARSCTAYADEVSELALAHVNSDATRAAYARDELLLKRRLLMQEWGKFCFTKSQPVDLLQLAKFRG